MKILYLWMENYNDYIFKQGISLSSEYKCKIDVIQDKIEVNITRDENFDPTFYSTSNESIVDITCIVGENGAGKSTILRSLIGLLNGQLYTNYIFICQQKIDGKDKFVIYNNSSYLIDSQDKYIIEDEYKGVENTQSIFYTPIFESFNFDLGSPRNSNKFINVSHTALLVEDLDEQQYEKSILPHSLMQIHESRNIYRQYKAIHETTSIPFHDIKNTLVLNDFKIELVEFKIPNWSKFERHTWSNLTLDLNEYLIGLYEKYQKELTALYKKRTINQSYDEKIDKSIIQIEIWSRMFISVLNSWNSEGYILDLEPPRGKFSLTPFLEKIKGVSLDFKTEVRKFLNWQTLVRGEIVISIIQELEKNLIIRKHTSGDVISFRVFGTDVLTLISNHENFILDLAKFSTQGKPVTPLEFGWHRNLSSGEKSMFDLFSRIYHAKSLMVDQLKQRLKPEEITKENIPNVFFFIDEGELGFHPEWSRRYINWLIDAFNQVFRIEGENMGKDLDELINFPVHIILTTHQPISLTDLHPSSVNYLYKKETIHDKYETKILDSHESKIPNFGANIHSLYKNSFFLEGGLIGEFAKNKIKSLVDFFENKKVCKKWTESEARIFIQIVGEPVLKEALWDLYSERFNKEIEEREFKKIIRENKELKEENERLKRANENDKNH